MTKYTIIGEMDFGNSGLVSVPDMETRYIKFFDWSEGVDVHDAISKLEKDLRERHPPMQDWELFFIFEGHHDECYPETEFDYA